MHPHWLPDLRCLDRRIPIFIFQKSLAYLQLDLDSHTHTHRHIYIASHKRWHDTTSPSNDKPIKWCLYGQHTTSPSNGAFLDEEHGQQRQGTATGSRDIQTHSWCRWIHQSHGWHCASHSRQDTSIDWYMFSCPLPEHTHIYTHNVRMVVYETDFFPSVLWHCRLGDRKGIRPVKHWVLVLLVVMIWLEICMFYSSSCHHHLRHP